MCILKPPYHHLASLVIVPANQRDSVSTVKAILPLKAHGSEERAEEDAGVRVALSGEEWQPAGALLDSFGWRFVSQQVRYPHGVVAKTLA